MPTPAYMSIKGETQGDITKDAYSADSVGNVWQEAHVDEFLVQELDHVLTVPRDPQSGQPTGQRVHRPVVVTKQQDRCSPLLFNALVSGEKLPECSINFYRTSTSGKQEHYYTIKLIDALLVDMQTRMAHCQDAAMADRVTEEVLKFTYRAIEVTHETCGTAGNDDWRTPREA
ncbi:Hcp family type VI secretion system effector [Aliivibrio fischeri]|uniref:Type VI secretion system tube protein Hcp n=2 Tax=Aliivibrio fischeri TaxID=668 RepID=A0A510UIA9_ALIFS|nr:MULTISPECIES: Hcp family type VI secretion system effector [Aliivibrio]ACH66110.1 BfdA [Aliivibrio fischeri MJ11]MBD1569787.1 Hcp family type VI secretion system effector [Aliivibrio sp. S10_S31]MBP3140056.1 Hcp family type VI secretion system effector [Aliivibrio fischeri]MBP3141995.1 Hcp family type VI secretion system effector [Aliivibrio fischeri]MBP3154437.1 Hcp family type VI secretion system effector [Aliivibrio fischeri]